jgi:uncharacterized protein YqeY
VSTVLRERLDAELKTAMRERDTLKLSVIRLVKAGILEEETKGTRKTLDDDGIMQVIVKEIKERRDAIAELTRAGRPELVEKAEAEIAALQAFLPPPLTPTELDALIDEAIRETGAAGPKDMGRVMAWLNPRTRGRAEGRVVADAVKTRLSS